MNRPRVPLPFPRDQSERIAWLNSSGEAIPAFACVKLFSYDDATNQFQADKPDGSDGLYYANGPATVATDKYSGSACWNLPRRCLLDATTYDVGDQVGPVSGQWGMGAAGTGWRVLRPPNADKEAVVQMIGGGGSSDIIKGVVSESLGRGYYTVEISEWSGVTPQDEEDPCILMTGSLSTSVDDNCETSDIPDFEPQTTGNGTFVLAYDPTSVTVPLQLGTDCLMVDLGDENNVTGSALSLSSGDTEPVFQIIRGYQTHTVQFKERWECCDGDYVLVAKTPIIFAALVCEEIKCEDCA